MLNKTTIKKTVILLSVLTVIASSCGQRTTNQTEIVNNETVSEQKKESTQNENEQSDSPNKFLITNNSVGYFNIAGSWQNFAENEYHFEYLQGYGSCVDACCNGGFDLGYGISKNEWDMQIIKDLKLTFGTTLFEDSNLRDETAETKYKNNHDIFYVSSDNCNGWYWKDKISFIIIHSDLFKTKEGVGVNTTLEEAQRKLGKLVFTIGWIEEDINAVEVNTNSYPNIGFILEADDYANGWEELSNHIGKANTLTISDFKEKSKIKRIIIRGENE